MPEEIYKKSKLLNKEQISQVLAFIESGSQAENKMRLSQQHYPLMGDGRGEGKE